jgi:hydroxymethylbilane synthase
MKKLLTVATRPGRLAIAQTQIAISALKKKYPGIKIQIKKVTTKGDHDRRTALWSLKESGFFTSKVEEILLAGQADLAVHSFKDLPTQERKGLTIAAVCDRQYAEDCLLTKESIRSIEQLQSSAKIGTSSLRRAAQLRHLRPDFQLVPIRGNVQTRVRLLDEGKVDAIVLARAGVERLGLGRRISFCFDPRQFLPAPAQGALAIQTRTDDVATTELVAAIDGGIARMLTFAERQILVTMQCGCHAPVGAFAKLVDENVEISAFISNLEGKNFIKREIIGPAEQANQLAVKLAEELLDAGGREILASIKE